MTRPELLNYISELFDTMIQVVVGDLDYTTDVEALDANNEYTSTQIDQTPREQPASPEDLPKQE